MMVKPRDGAHRIMKALTAMLIVAGCLPCAVGNDGSSAAAVRQKAKRFEEAGRGGGGGGGVAPAVAATALPAEAESPESLLKRGTAMLNEGLSKEAVGILDVAMALWDEESDSNKLESPAVAQTAQRLGEALALEGEDERAAVAFTRAFAASEIRFGSESAQAVASLTGLGLALLRQGQLSEAASTLATALQARELRRDRELKQNGGIGAATQDAITNLDGLAKALGRRSPKDGEGELEGALLAVDHINRLAWRYFVQNLPFEGHSVMGEVLESFQREEEEEEEAGSSPSPPRDLIMSALLFNLGFLRLAVLGQYELAANVLKEAHELRKTVLGEVHSLTVQAAVSRGWALTLTGETRMAVKELTGSAEALLTAGQPHAADRLLRQALQQGYDPLGVTTYAHACVTQHGNMLRGWGNEGKDTANEITRTQQLIAQKATLTGKEQGMKHARKTLTVALQAQIEDETEGSQLLQLSPSDKERLLEEIELLRK